VPNSSKQCFAAAVRDGQARAISLAALTILEVSPVEGARIAARCGYSHIGLRPIAATPVEPHFPIMADAVLRRELKAAIRDEGIAVLDIEIVRLLPEMDWDAMAMVFAFAQEFGAERLLVADNDPDPLRSHDSLAELASRAGAYGVTPHLEFMPWTCAPDLMAGRERLAGIANGRLLVDAFHLARSGGTVDDIVQAKAGTGIGYLQLCDIAGPIPAMDEILREARSARLFPGDGDIDLVSLLKTLPDIPISLEIPADALRDLGVTAETRALMAIGKAQHILARADATA
jgi:sugar phosphate isomerase/epimerase